MINKNKSSTNTTQTSIPNSDFKSKVNSTNPSQDVLLISQFHTDLTTNKNLRCNSDLTRRISEAKKAINGEYTFKGLTKDETDMIGELNYDPKRNVLLDAVHLLDTVFAKVRTFYKSKPFVLEATPIPTLPEIHLEGIIDTIIEQLNLEELTSLGADISMLEDAKDFKDLVNSLKRAKLTIINNEVNDKVLRMESKMYDQFNEGGWIKAHDDFTYNLITLPFAVMKAPTPVVNRNNDNREWEGSALYESQPFNIGFTNVDPTQFLPSSNTLDIEVQDNIIELLTLDKETLGKMYTSSDYINIDKVIALMKENAIHRRSDSHQDLAPQHKHTNSNITIRKGSIFDKGAKDNVFTLPKDFINASYEEDQLLETQTSDKVALYTKRVLGIEVKAYLQDLKENNPEDAKLLKSLYHKKFDEAYQDYKLYKITMMIYKDTIMYLNITSNIKFPYKVMSFRTNNTLIGYGVHDLTKHIIANINENYKDLSIKIKDVSREIIVQDENLLDNSTATYANKSKYSERVIKAKESVKGTTTSQPITRVAASSSGLSLLINVNQSLVNELYKVLGVDRILEGFASNALSGNASNYRSALNGANSKIEQLNSRFNELVVYPVVADLYDLNLQHLDDDLVKGDANIVVQGIEGLIERENNKNSLATVVQLLQVLSDRGIYDQSTLKSVADTLIAQNGVDISSIEAQNNIGVVVGNAFGETNNTAPVSADQVETLRQQNDGRFVS